MPNWRIGADSIGFAIRELRARGLAERRSGVVLVGHSNGGDMAMLFASEHPELVRAVFSLDNRRHPLPRTRRPRICSVRSGDQQPDPGVLPTAEEQRALGMQFTPVAGLLHNDMWDGAAPEYRERMVQALDACLRY
jgi:pimeloyl-ACP methyl ester carboxylesterase